VPRDPSQDVSRELERVREQPRLYKPSDVGASFESRSNDWFMPFLRTASRTNAVRFVVLAVSMHHACVSHCRPEGADA
jgi:hypothetical protein